MLKTQFLAFASLLLLLTFAGCGGSDLGGVTGTVLIDGQPAPPGLNIEFDPVEKGVRGSTAVTGDGGRYEATYSLSRNGVRTGECIVKLVAPETPPSRPGKKPKLPFPSKYYDEIRKVEISGWSNTVDLEISKTGA